MTELQKSWNLHFARVWGDDGDLERMICLVEKGVVDAQSEFTYACVNGYVGVARGLLEHCHDRLDLSDGEGLVVHLINVDLLRSLLDLSKRGIAGPISQSFLCRKFHRAVKTRYIATAQCLFEWCGGWANNPRFDIHKNNDEAFRAAVLMRRPFAVRILTWCEARLDKGGRRVDLHADNDYVFRWLIEGNDVPGARWYAHLCNDTRFGGPTPIALDVSRVFLGACEYKSFEAAAWVATAFGLHVPGVFTSRAASSVLAALCLWRAFSEFRLAFCWAPERRRAARVNFLRKL